MFMKSVITKYKGNNITTQATFQKRHSMELLSISKAARWASMYLQKNISESNISYLIQYGKLKKHGGNGSTLINIEDLRMYYDSYNGRREINWRKKLGGDLNWALSFDHLREKDTTKHVHRLHPYKGKFIPQLVEYFIDNHVNDLKKEAYFKKGDTILDPFSGSGTALVQANELGINSIGIDVSHFNCTIAEIKLTDYNLQLLKKEIENLINTLAALEIDNKVKEFESELNEKLGRFNCTYFSSSDYKYKINRGEINEDKHAKEKEVAFLSAYNKLVEKYGIRLKQPSSDRFLDKWYIDNVRKEIDFTFNLIKKISDIKIKKVLAVILSRTIRSCRSTTHSDLATLKEPQLTTYYCYKHKKICKPIFSIKNMFSRYALDTIERLQTFSELKTNAYHILIPGDSRTVNIFDIIKKKNPPFFQLVKKHKIKGIFTSPPYVGQIDYHEQHAYAYDLFGYKRKDELEIGPLCRGRGMEARRSYAEGISAVLQNCRPYLSENFDVFLVANDKFNLYPEIAKKSGMKMVNQFKRPVLNRTERDKSPYSEIIFHFKNCG